MDKLRSGADGDGFYVRVNTDRIGETNDELDVKQVSFTSSDMDVIVKFRVKSYSLTILSLWDNTEDGEHGR